MGKIGMEDVPGKTPSKIGNMNGRDLMSSDRKGMKKTVNLRDSRG